MSNELQNPQPKHQYLQKPQIQSQNFSSSQGSRNQNFNESMMITDKDVGTENYVDDMRTGKNNVLVSVRVRPLSRQEQEKNFFNVVSVLDDKVVILYDPQEVVNSGGLYEYQNNSNNNGLQRNKEKQYAFDYVFDRHISHETLFDRSVKFALDGVLEGFNATVFAYGATGAGKTYTMLGTDDQYGIMGLTFLELFRKIEDQRKNKDFKILMSYLEIYNENIRDLLIQNSDNRNLDLREDVTRGVIVTGLTEVIATSVDEVMSLLKIGNKNRSTEATNANETSSRSHAILQVIIEYKDKNSGTETDLNFAKLSMIDLAGSERASSTLNKGARQQEGAAINKSLLSLGNCINALATQKPGEKQYIPYRDSKLTRFLKDSLGGNCRTVMIANISPSSATYEDTHNTLLYANRAKKIKNKLERNTLNVNFHVGKYTQIIAQLKVELADMKFQLQKKDHESNAGLGFFGGMKNIPGFEKFKSDLRQHFEDETKIRMQTSECEKRIDEMGFNLLKLKNDASQKTRDLGKGHLATKKVLDEIDQSYEMIGQNKASKEELEEQLQEYISKRDTYPLLWKNSNELHGGELPQAYLNLLLKYLQEQVYMRDNMLERARELLKQNHIKFQPDNEYDPDGVYDMLENAETSFPLLKVSRSSKLIRRRELNIDDNQGHSIHVSQTPKSKQASFLPPISQNQSPGAGAYAKMMESKKSRMSNFSRSQDRLNDRPNNNGVGYYKGPQGPNVVVTKLSKQLEMPSQNDQNNRYLRQVQSQQKLETMPQAQIQLATQIKEDQSEKPQQSFSGLKRRPTIILRPKDNKPYLLVKTTRAKEEEKQKNNLTSVLHPHTQSQPLLKYHRSFKSVVEQMPNTNNSFEGSVRSDNSRSLDRSEISMYNTDNERVKRIYTTKSLITQRFLHSPYINSPTKKKELQKPWRVNMSLNNKNFVEHHEQNKFLTNLQKDVTMNTNHIQSLKRKVGPSNGKAKII